MNDKIQLAAMGEHMAEQQQPMCMAKRIKELEMQVEKLTNRLAWRNTGSPNGLRRFMTQKQYDAQTPGIQKWYEPIRCEVPEGWQLVPAQAADAHPMQPILLDPTGRPRFKKNSAVEYLAEGRLNEIASRGYSDEDMTQLAQLIGYSVDGFSELSYVSDADYERAVAAAPSQEAK